VPVTFHHISLRVTDLAQARAFYEGILGFGVDQDFPGRKLRFRLDGTGTRLVVRPPLPGTPEGDRFSERRIGLDHVAFGTSRDGVLAMTRRLREAGVPADLHDDEGYAVLTFRDPDNIQWEYFQDQSSHRTL
jgi:glyoxylase I family protein